MPTPCLAEERKFAYASDESLCREIDPPFTDGSCDWGSDPMEILMAKQEVERLELQYQLAYPRKH